jgi:hypothetical protein
MIILTGEGQADTGESVDCKTCLESGVASVAGDEPVR